MTMQLVLPQMSTPVERTGVARGEAACDPASEEMRGPRRGNEHTGSVLLRAALTRENLQAALMRVRANVLLDEVDKELERRGHCFARYADDCNVYVRSPRAGERVMNLLRRLYARLHLKVNETKSAVASVFTDRKFLGYSFWVAPKGVVNHTENLARARRVDATPVASNPAQAVEAWQDHVPGIVRTGCQQGGGATGGG